MDIEGGGEDLAAQLDQTGLVHDEARDELRLYYGAADLCVAMASARFSEVVDYLVSLPPENE